MGTASEEPTPPAPPATLSARVWWLSAIAAVAFAALASRAVYVVTATGPKPAPTARAARRAPVRGSILAADGTVLAESVTGYEVDVAPATLLRAPLAIDRLAALLGYNDTLTLHGEVQRAATHGTRVLRLRRDVDPSVAQRIRRERRELPGVWVTDVPRRRYPLGALTAFPVGSMGDVDARDLAEPVGYRRGDQVGRAGIEQSWELTLRGVSSHAPEHLGMTLGTTLDLSLQRAAAAACEQGVGAVVALDPRDGRVLAYLERTAADPSPFVDAEVDLTSPSTSPSVDGASGAVQTWEVTERDAIFAALSVANGGPRIPRDELEQRARALGFGHGTGVDLRDEAEGSLREVHHRDDGDSEEGRFTIAIRATPLQVAVAFAAIVNGGVLYQPRLVDRVLSPDGAIALRRDAPVVRSRAELTAGARDRVLATMRQATRDIVGWSLGADGYVALAPAVDPRLVVVARYASGSLARGDLRDASEPAALAVARAWLSRTHATGDSQP